MKQIAWCPQGVELEFGSVLIQPGLVTERMWLQALSDRLTSLVLKESNPAQAFKQAAKAMEYDQYSDNPQEAGQFLVEGNSELQEHLRNQMAPHEGDLWPQQASVENLDAKQAMEETDLMMWAGIARSTVSSSVRG